MSESPETTAPQPAWRRLLASELTLGTLVVLLSVFTAWAAYQGSLSDSAEGDFNVAAQKELSESNTMQLETTQHVVQDYTMFDGYYLNQETNPEVADYYYANFSEELLASIEKTPDQPFDDAYYDTMYAEAMAQYETAVANFDEAKKAGDLADAYQLVLLIFAVGLSLAAWASLTKETSRLRWLFSLISIIIAVVGLARFFGLYLQA